MGVSFVEFIAFFEVKNGFLTRVPELQEEVTNAPFLNQSSLKSDVRLFGITSTANRRQSVGS
jgi:hypothetical protein